MACSTVPLAPPGLICPACGQCEFHTGQDDAGRLRLYCFDCGIAVRLVRRHGDPEPELAPFPPSGSAYAHQPPTPDCRWLVFVRSADLVWRPIGMTSTLERAWDIALTSPLDGDVMMVSTDPPRRSKP